MEIWFPSVDGALVTVTRAVSLDFEVGLAAAAVDWITVVVGTTGGGGM